MTSTAGFDYTLTRDLDAPAEAVWRAWTVAEDYGQWASAEEVVLDVRPGGAWSSVMVIPGGTRIPLSGGYTEVVENKRLVMGMNVPDRDEPVLMALDLAAHGDRTQITLSQTFDTAEDRDQAEQGSTMLLDSLTAYLAAA
ncbi:MULTISPECIES: SRPBCC domain-containing protein [unclassified Pseudofrankia]|uniref:SRPBCC family protein n=1 Tax=unclassified Pseudofrankia TaxID=2994372 RepID=UPI0008DB138A|nr:MULTISPECIES: SRPBCC domain-containing protein [unclassified Pseudofrankia]MDT3442486.1 SRPBCC domain-containing protein [Pseudofrankia sp. BMG5.37]OHV74722.1 ATPase [Pseudofrankia sp. BMG5.36]